MAARGLNELEGAFAPEMIDALRGLGLSPDGALDELGIDSEAMIRDPVSSLRALDGPKAKKMSPVVAGREAEARRTNILESHRILSDIVGRHEATIQKRWAKKTNKQRLAILLNAWPNMPVAHRSDIFAYRLTKSFGEFAKMINMNDTGVRAQSLWPSINQEDLLKARTLPLMLNSRGRNHPSAFAGLDRAEMSVGLRWFAFVPVNVPGYVMLLNRIDEHNAKDYGAIVKREPRDGSKISKTAPTPEKQYLVGEGLLILEVQEKLLQFLVECCYAILHDIPREKVLDPQYPVQPSPKLKEESESTGYESLQVLAQEAPYRAAAHLDLDRVVSLLTARAKAAEDHMWSLREDPNYFHDTVLEYMDHRIEIFWGNPDDTDASRVVHWPSLLIMMLGDAYRELETYAELRRQAVELLALQTKVSAQIHPSKDLPIEFLDAIIRFRTYLWQAVSGHFKQLEDGVAPSPPMRHLFQYSHEHESVVAHLDNMNKVEESLVWLLSTLYEDGEDLEVLGITKTMDELQHLISGKPEAKKFISSYVGRAIGDLSVLAQCYRQLELYQPWAQEFEFEAAKRDKMMKNEYFAWKASWVKIPTAFSPDTLKQAGRLADPQGGKFLYSIDRRPSRDTVEKLRRAEANLDAFWRCIDKLVHTKLPGMKGTFTGQFLNDSRILKRTPEWVEKTKPSDPSPSQVQLYEPLSPFFTEYGQASSSTRLDLPSPKEKVKTKGVANPSTDAATTETPPPGPESEEPSITIPVDGRSFKVFRALFFNPDITSTPGEIPWNDFLHAMTSVGFVAEKLYGSVWQFRPEFRPADNKNFHVTDMNQAIQFHEPHPKPKIPFNTARRFGRRLFRQYGWVGRMFVLNK